MRLQAGTERKVQVEAAFLLALGRKPDAAERTAAQRFFATSAGDKRALARFCQALMILNESSYLE